MSSTYVVGTMENMLRSHYRVLAKPKTEIGEKALITAVNQIIRHKTLTYNAHILSIIHQLGEEKSERREGLAELIKLLPAIAEHFVNTDINYESLKTALQNQRKGFQ